MARHGATRAPLVRLKKKRDFQNHLLAFVVINAAVWVLWATTGAGYPWPAWITGIWAVGLVFNAWDVFRRPISEADVQDEIKRARPQH
ncbi:MAG TPA: 2TM domain-containing protein [Solirubrobacteraceae bacterium]|nr:2TM domain-containing protein [Solirubrobacteraceae bacterium]